MKKELKNLVKKLIGYKKPPEPMMYRVHLFNEFLSVAGGHFNHKRILEIGPKDGLDSKRLDALKPSELIFFDLPDKHKGNQQWLGEIKSPHAFIEQNFLYMPPADYHELSTFDLIYFTGILYHNAEQLRFLRKLYLLLNVGGYLVLESATLRKPRSLRDGDYVQIHYPKIYNEARTVTHLPTKGAIKAWLQMVGFTRIIDSHCYDKENKNLTGDRYACIAVKTGKDDGDVYYNKNDENPPYRIGDAT